MITFIVESVNIPARALQPLKNGLINGSLEKIFGNFEPPHFAYWREVVKKLMVIAVSTAFLTGCATKVSTDLTSNPNVVISNIGANNWPAFEQVRFSRSSTLETHAEACMQKITGTSPANIRDEYSVTAKTVYISEGMKRSIPFQYSLTLTPEEGTYLFEDIRIHEGELGGPLPAGNAFNGEQAYAQMESIVERIQDCL